MDQVHTAYFEMSMKKSRMECSGHYGALSFYQGHYEIFKVQRSYNEVTKLLHSNRKPETLNALNHWHEHKNIIFDIENGK